MSIIQKGQNSKPRSIRKLQNYKSVRKVYFFKKYIHLQFYRHFIFATFIFILSVNFRLDFSDP